MSVSCRWCATLALSDDFWFHLAEITTSFGVGAASVGGASWVPAAGAGVLCCLARQGFVFFGGRFEFTPWRRNGHWCAHMISGTKADISVLHLADISTVGTIASGKSDSGFTVGAGVAIFELVVHILGRYQAGLITSIPI